MTGSDVGGDSPRRITHSLIIVVRNGNIIKGEGGDWKAVAEAEESPLP